MSAPHWLSRHTVRAPRMTLCLSDEAFRQAVAHCNLSDAGKWLDPKQLACVHTWDSDDALICIVCLSPDSIGADPIDVASTLVHEAVHIFQRLCDSIGESAPGREFEAYSIERIAEGLMREFVRQTTAEA